jgi:hypothetical protein
MEDKFYICSIAEYVDNLDNKMYALKIREFGNNGFNDKRELEFDFCLDENLSWEKKQIDHYFEYDTEIPIVITNNKEMFLNLVTREVQLVKRILV